jgi:hypothetical protein
MQTFAMLISLLLMPILSPPQAQPNVSFNNKTAAQQTPGAQTAKQLFAVRGVIVSKKALTKGELQLTIKPAKDFKDVTVTARENDLVGSASRRLNDSDVLGLLGDEANESGDITAAELDEGDIVSVIYDPQQQNRVIEIYIH